MENANNTEQLVFGLDIGTRNVVGTVGYKTEREFYVAAQCVKEHQTRAMIDGQIHDIGRVGKTIAEVKEELESQIEGNLTDVCIAAAGRVLKTVTTLVEYEFPEETVVTKEHIHTLDLLGIEQAQAILKERNDTKYKFYCVGYSTVKYYLNDEVFSNLESHKADKISEDIIVTFLPEDVVDGLYSAVGLADLSVANLTLEPIAAINVAIPEAFRMLNIALVDVGAGTSDISITRDGSIIAYGMIPFAGDELTELIVQNYLVDFNTAEHIKLVSGTESEVTFEDIMSIEHTIPSEEVWALTKPIVDKITAEIAAKIKELNGDKSVSACFVVGGGGKIHGFTENLAVELELPKERVALRGEEVLKEVHFAQEEIKKDPLLVTPVGICLNYYDQKNNFIMVHFNNERIKLYDNGHLTIVDAALSAGFPNEQLFPRRGTAIHFMVNGKQRIVRGEAGESAIVKVNDAVVNINAPLEPNSYITIEPSTEGERATYTIEQLEEYTTSTISFVVNGRMIICPKFVEVNGSLEPASYQIQENDRIETRAFYTLGQLAEFMDVEVDLEKEILVNNREADMDTLVYENFEVQWEVLSFASAPVEPKFVPEVKTVFDEDVEESEAAPEVSMNAEEVEIVSEMTEPTVAEATDAEVTTPSSTETTEDGAESQNAAESQGETESQNATESQNVAESQSEAESQADSKALTVIVNNQPIVLDEKENYVFVDIFDYIDFDLAHSNGRLIVTQVNGVDAQYTQPLRNGDRIEIYWKENN